MSRADGYGEEMPSDLELMCMDARDEALNPVGNALIAMCAPLEVSVFVLRKTKYTNLNITG